MHLESNGLSEHTVRAYVSDLRIWLEYAGDMPAWDNADQVARQWLNAFRRIWSPATTARRLSVLRRYAHYYGHPEFLMNYKSPVAAQPNPHPIPELMAGVLRMIQSTTSYKHKACIALNGLMGLRISEVVAVRPRDIDLDNMELTVHGKGQKTRIVPIDPAVWRYLRVSFGHAVQENTTLVRMTERGARAAITRHGERANLSQHVASHDLRSTFATVAYSNSLDLRAVQDLMGHADAKTTQRYTKVSDQTKRNAVSFLP